MRLPIYILTFLLTTSIVSAQSWKDSLQLGKQHYKEGNFEEAYQTLLEAQKIAPSDVDLSQDIGNAAYRNGDYKMAEKAYQSAASNKIDKNAQSKQWHNVGNSQMKEKNYQAAIDSYKKALYLHPDDDRTRYNLAEAKRRIKQQEEKKQQQNQDQQNQDQQQKDKQQSQKDKDDTAASDNKQQEKQNNPSSGTNNDESLSEPKGKLSDRKSDRMLEDLLKDEMQTKRKVRGAESKINHEHSKSGKRW